MAEPTTQACDPCASSVNENYTLHTFWLFICDGSTEYDVGNVVNGNFRGSPELKPHFRGQTGEQDGLFVLRRPLEVVATLDEMTIRNLSFLLNDDFANDVDSQCRIPLSSGTTLKNYATRLVHQFPDGTKELEIVFHNASIASAFDISFSDDFASFQLTITALKCPTPPTAGEDYGYLRINELCPVS